MTANALTLSEAAIAPMIADIRRFGVMSVETGGFLLAPRDADTISIVALAGRTGIVRRSDLFQVSEIALDRLFAYADKNELWVPAQFHSHRFAAFMSQTDADHGLSVEGFVTTIVPQFAAPPADPSQWGWWRYKDAWSAIAPARVSNDSISVVTFDEDGVDGT